MSNTTKHPYNDIHPVAARLVSALRPHCHRIELAGSLRRQRPLIGDIEICAIPIRPTNLFGEELEDRPTALDRFLDTLVSEGHDLNFTKRGPKYQRFRFGRYEVDLFLATQLTWGSVFTIRTGSADFSQWLVTQEPLGACPWLVRFGNDGAAPGRLIHNGRLLATPEEEDVFAALGLAYIPPTERNGPPPNPARVPPVWRYE